MAGKMLESEEAKEQIAHALAAGQSQTVIAQAMARNTHPGYRG